MKQDVYETVTNKVLEMMETHGANWINPFARKGKALLPHNIISKKPYRGINHLMLLWSPYETPAWGTFKQWNDQGCSVRKGEKSTPIVFWQFIEKEDDKGQKISKSKGNGLNIEQWLDYGPPESLALYMFQSPRKAKRLHYDVIPRAIEDYADFLSRYPEQPIEQQLGNPVHHIHEGKPPAQILPVSFSLLLNLASVAATDDPARLWGFVKRYAPGSSPETHPMLDRLVHHAAAYARDFVVPGLNRRAPTETEAAALRDLDARLLHPADVRLRCRQLFKAVG